MVPLEFAPRQSYFVVFRKPASGEKGSARNFPPLSILSELSGAWEVDFDPARGGPGSVAFDNLQDWTDRPEDGIRHYSGTATYRTTFTLPDVP